MRRFAAGGFLGLVLLLSSALSQAPQRVTIGKNIFAFHEEKFSDRTLEIQPPIVSDIEILVEQIGIPNISKINELRLQIRRVLGLKNAAALEDGGYRTVAYDPEWAAGDTPGFYLVLGHEIGHQFCGHTVGEVR
jgi:hypothetical protein